MDRKAIADGGYRNLTRTTDLSLPVATPEAVRPEPALTMGWKEQAQRLQKEAHVFYLCLSIPTRLGM